MAVGRDKFYLSTVSKTGLSAQRRGAGSASGFIGWIWSGAKSDGTQTRSHTEKTNKRDKLPHPRRLHRGQPNTTTTTARLRRHTHGEATDMSKEPTGTRCQASPTRLRGQGRCIKSGQVKSTPVRNHERIYRSLTEIFPIRQ